MLSFSHLFEEVPVSALSPVFKTALKQAAVWGISGGLAAKLSGEHRNMTRQEKKQLAKDVAIATGSGIAAGAIGSMV